ncbi:unnamed protein product, partial [Musa acuminata subsp. malaccensis]
APPPSTATAPPSSTTWSLTHRRCLRPLLPRHLPRRRGDGARPPTLRPCTTCTSSCR